MHARELARVGGLRRRLFETAERRWAHACDAVLTVNDEYAAILQRQLHLLDGFLVPGLVVMHGRFALLSVWPFALGRSTFPEARRYYGRC
jgi:hypothetical protein